MEISATVSKDVHYVFASYFEGAETLAYAVSRALADGSICLDVMSYKENMSGHPDAMGVNPYWQDCESFDEQLKNARWVTDGLEVLKPFVLMNGRLYLHRYFTYESWIIDNIRRLDQNFRIITGGPGTGKTFGVAHEIVKLLSETPSLKIAMAAPTGKAAARMNESIRKFVTGNHQAIPEQIKEILLSLKAKTLHRLLGYMSNSVFFRYNETNRLPYDIVIVDEASMIDGAMMAKLLNAIDDATRFMLIGDKDQLASVEAGSVFGDICRSMEAPLLQGKVEVKRENYRAKDSPGIIRFSQKTIEGDAAFLSGYRDDDQVVIDTLYSEELFAEQALLYKEFILEEDIQKALAKLNRVRFLCATRSFDHSVAETNLRIERLLKAAINNPVVFNPANGFYHNQPIIITQNDYDLGLNNGDTGLLRRSKEGSLIAFFENGEGQLLEKKAGYINHFQTVFAMTIHKSQGSEFENVVVLLPEGSAGKMLTRELLYTAITRARKKVLIQSRMEVLEQCARSSVSRASGLTERLQKASL